MKIINANVFIRDSFLRGSVTFDEKILQVTTEAAGSSSATGINASVPGKSMTAASGSGPASTAYSENSAISPSVAGSSSAAGTSPAAAPSTAEYILDAEGGYLIPGLIDVHTHAAMGADASDGDEEGLHLMAKYYAAGGVTTFFPTTLTLPEENLKKTILMAKNFEREENEARVGGVHLEGPFINMEKRGAQNPEYVRNPDIEFFRRLVEAGEGIVKFITVAPETEGAIEFIREASKVCSVSLGHTNCDYDTAMQGFRAGAKHITHLYNAMPSLLHRAPGLIAAGVDAGAEAEIITDGIHSHPAMVRIAHKLFGKNLILISDSIRCAGMPDGEYELGGLPFTLKEGKATITGTDTIAGSAIHLMDGLRCSVKFGIPLEDAVYAASTRPAISAGMEGSIGAIKEGLLADMVLLDKELNVKAVFVGGKKIQNPHKKP